MVIIVSLVGVPTVYMSAYYAMVKSTNPFGGAPMYRIDSPFVAALFWPAFKVDEFFDSLRS